MADNNGKEKKIQVEYTNLLFKMIPDAILEEIIDTLAIDIVEEINLTGLKRKRNNKKSSEKTIDKSQDDIYT